MPVPQDFLGPWISKSNLKWDFSHFVIVEIASRLGIFIGNLSNFGSKPCQHDYTSIHDREPYNTLHNWIINQIIILCVHKIIEGWNHSYIKENFG